MLDGPDDALFLHGACHVFAAALRERFPWYKLRMARKRGEVPPKGASHVYCVFDDSYGVDVLGLFDEIQRLEQMGYTDATHDFPDICESDLKAFETLSSGGGLFVSPSFIAKTRERALDVIDRFHDYYSGRKQGPPPGFSLFKRADLETIFNDSLTNGA